MRKLGSRYVLETLLGRGTSGDVWRGTRTDDDSVVAIKVLRPELADNGAIVDRFLREYSVLLQLDGPNLVRVHDLVVDDDALAIVMDLVEGVDLRDLLRRNGQLSPARALDVVLGVLEALAVVHETGVVHRDVKPENILIEGGGQGRLRPKLTDFGIATLTHSPRASRMTDVVGTPTYMAPELAEGEPPSPLSDLYAVGVVCYELLTGAPPFDAPHPIGMMRAHREDPVPPVPGLSPAIAEILGDLLAKSPRRRPPSAREAWRALAGAADHDARQIDLDRVLPRHAPPTQAPARPVAAGQRAASQAPRTTAVGVGPGHANGNRSVEAAPVREGWNRDDSEHTLHTAEQWAAAGAPVGAPQGFWTKDGAAFVTPATGAGTGANSLSPESDLELTQVAGAMTGAGLTSVGAGVGSAPVRPGAPTTRPSGPMRPGGPPRPTGPMRPAHDEMTSTMVSRAQELDASDLDTGPLPQPRRSAAGAFPTGPGGHGGGGGNRRNDYEDRRRKWIVAGATTAVLLVAGLGGWALAAEPNGSGASPAARSGSPSAGAFLPGSVASPADVPTVLVSTMVDGTMTTVPSPVPPASQPGSSGQPAPPGQPSSQAPGPTQSSNAPAPSTSPPPATSGPAPDLTGLTPANGRRQLQEAGFTGGLTTEAQCQNGAKVGTLHNQNPRAGTTTAFTAGFSAKLQPDNCATVPYAQTTVETTVATIKGAGFTNVTSPNCANGATNISVDLGGWYIPTTTQITVTATCKAPPATTPPAGGTRN